MATVLFEKMHAFEAAAKSARVPYKGRRSEAGRLGTQGNPSCRNTRCRG
jgi:hypothetical protein